MTSSLYERLGGESAVEAAVVRFHRKIVANPLLAPFFAGYDVGDQMERHISFMIRVFGGPSERNADLGLVHAKLVARGLGGAHVDAFIRVLADVLAELDVGEAEIREVVAIAEQARPAVLGGSGGGGGGGGGSVKRASGTIRTLAFDRVEIADGGPTRRSYSAEDFLALPLSIRVTYVVQNRAFFYAGDVQIDADTALADARKRRLAS